MIEIDYNLCASAAPKVFGWKAPTTAVVARRLRGFGHSWSSIEAVMGIPRQTLADEVATLCQMNYRDQEVRRRWRKYTSVTYHQRKRQGVAA